MADSSRAMVLGSNCWTTLSVPLPDFPQNPTHHSRRDDSLNLSSVGAHQNPVLFNDAVKQVEAVVLGQHLQEVLDGLVRARHLQDLSNHKLLVPSLEGRRGEDVGELGVFVKGSLQVLECLVGGLKALRLCGCSVLFFFFTCTSSITIGMLFSDDEEGASYQRRSVGAVDAEEGNGRLERFAGICCCDGVASDAHAGNKGGGADGEHGEDAGTRAGEGRLL